MLHIPEEDTHSILHHHHHHTGLDQVESVKSMDQVIRSHNVSESIVSLVPCLTDTNLLVGRTATP